MTTIEVVTFRLAPDAGEAEFLEADKHAQKEFFYARPGLLRRTTARNGTGWLVITLWVSTEEADACAESARTNRAVARWAVLVDQTSLTTSRYDTLD